MEKKFTRAMLCEEFKSKCRECPLHSDNNPKSLPCWLIDESDIQDIMKDYPYVDVKVRMIFNDIETRLTAVEKKVENNVSVEFKPERVVFGCSYNRDIGFSTEVVDQKLYDKLEAKHEADCRLISEYDLENKRLKDENIKQNDTICDLYSNLCSEQRERIRCEAVIEDKKKQIDENNNLEDRYRIHIADLKSKLFDLKNVENERDHYKGLYSSKCDDYDSLLAKQMKTQKDFTFYRNAYMESIRELEETNDRLSVFKKEKSLRIASLESKLRNQRANLTSLQEKYETVLNTKNSLEFKNAALETENNAITKTFESISESYNKLKSDYYIAQENLKITKEKYDKLLKDYKLLSESNNNHAKDNVELEGELEEKTNRIAALEDKLRNQRTNLASLQEKYEDAVKMNKAREDVYYANIKLQKTIEAKDREIGLLRAELDKYAKTDDECDDGWID